MINNRNKNTIRLAIKGFSWNLLGNLTRSLAGFVINVILARLLGPEPFGIMAMALLINSIGNLIIESGLGSALIQQKEIDSEDISFVFSIQMAFSLFLTILIVFLSPWLARQFSSPNAVQVLQVMSIVLVLQAFAQVPSALLRREMNFKRLQLIQVISFLVGYLGIGLPLAMARLGVWSLVAAQIIQSGITALLVFLSARHSLRLSFKGSTKFALFGIRILLANIANWIILFIDQAIVGVKFGTTNLGYYSRAYFLSSTPTGILLSSAQTSLFSATSKMGRSPGTNRIFRGFMSLFALIFFSIYSLVALESTNIIEIVYGKTWLPASLLLTPLAIAMPFRALVGLEGPVVTGLGKPQYEMWAQWGTAVFAVIVLLITSRISLEVMAWSIVVIYIVRFIIMSILTIKILEISWLKFFHPIFSGLLFEVVIFLIWSLVSSMLPLSLPLIIVTMIRCISALIAIIMIFWIGRKWLFPEIPSVQTTIKSIFKAGKY